MKNSSNDGFDQHYNVQTVVDQDSLLIVASALSNHPNDKREAEPDLDALPPQLGKPTAATLDNGYWNPATVQALDDHGIDAYIATGRDAHHKSWQAFFAEEPAPPPAEASLKVKMAYTCGAVLPQTSDGDRSGHLSAAQMHRRTRDWHHLRKCWAFASTPCAAWSRPVANGVWSVWPSISSACMCY